MLITPFVLLHIFENFVICYFQHLPVELGGMLNNDIETWLTVQQHVDSFTYRLVNTIVGRGWLVVGYSWLTG